jgi:transglutaminase-like putative cysteine protease
VSRLRIRHSTGFRYPGKVVQSYNEARMLPSTDEGQFVLFSNLEISPMSSSHGYVDYWGTRVNSFEILTPHEELSLTATSLVEVRRVPHESHGSTWDELLLDAGRRVETVEQMRQTPLTQPADEVVAIARRWADGHPPCEAALGIARELGEQVEYVTGVTGVTSTAADAWAERRGVCQDITHIVLGALRAVGIPARYVSGYLHPDPDARVGVPVVGESHAWVEWYCGGWRGFDPTNLIDIGDRHVLVGRGRDYGDVAPLRGVYAGPFRSELFVQVEITKEA